MWTWDETFKLTGMWYDNEGQCQFKTEDTAQQTEHPGVLSVQVSQNFTINISPESTSKIGIALSYSH